MTKFKVVKIVGNIEEHLGCYVSYCEEYYYGVYYLNKHRKCSLLLGLFSYDKIGYNLRNVHYITTCEIFITSWLI